ncbi:TRI39 ligase, partial [Cepphus grylle]|nr:TRI39 ligase [Cepphus grylle]
MATWNPTESLRRETSCSICLGYFQDPVSIHCGHNFCRECITRCWEGLEAHFSCPQCRQMALQKSFRPSRELAKIAEIARQLSLGGGGGGGGRENVCRQHQEVLKLFCKDDQQPICVVCDRSQAHRSHAVVPVEEAAQEYKVKPRDALAPHGKSLFQGIRLHPLQKTGIFQVSFTHRYLSRSHQFLEAASVFEGNLTTRLSCSCTLPCVRDSDYCWSIKYSTHGFFPPTPLLFCSLCSCEMMKFEPPVEISSDLERRLEDFVQRNVLVRGTLRKCQGTQEGEEKAPNVTLDPSTAHPNLHLSEDRKQARGQLRQKDLPDNPERFDFEPCVLGCEGFTSGRHFWEVEVGQGGVWALGVARASVKRKGPMSFTPKEGVWALEAYHSLTSPRANLRLNPLPRRIRVSLDYEGGWVAFFSAHDDVPILVYTRASFNGERVFPWFKMGMGPRLQEITQSPPSEDQSMTGQLMSPLDWVGFRFPLRICP